MPIYYFSSESGTVSGFGVLSEGAHCGGREGRGAPALLLLAADGQARRHYMPVAVRQGGSGMLLAELGGPEQPSGWLSERW